MFKKLRERIAEEANKLPVGQIGFGNNATRPPDLTARLPDTSEDLITLCDSSSVIVPHSSSQQFSIADDEDHSEQSTPQKKLGNNSAGSELFSTPNSSFKEPVHAVNNIPSGLNTPNSQYTPQTDIESEVEDPAVLNLDGISKEQLLSTIQTLKARLCKYKNKYTEVVKAYKTMDEEKKKVEHALTENQDKSLRRIAELREQCQLEQKAKAHLEENLRLILEEKDSRISVLETQINLLKEGQSESYFESSETTLKTEQTDSLEEKVNQMHSLLKECEATVAAQRDQISELTSEKQSLVKQLDVLQKASEEFKDKELKIRSEHEEVLENLKKQLHKLEKQQEDSVMSMAETKRNMHEELELKERQLNKTKEEARQLQAALDQEKAAVMILQKQHDDKIRELQAQLESMENSMEEEKENLMRDFSRGKAEAVALMQQESSKKSASLEDEWKAKLQSVQEENEIALQKKVDELKKQEEELLVAKQEILSLVESVEELKHENANLSKMLEDSKSEVDELKKQEEELLVAKQEILSLVESVEELKHENANLSKMLEDSKFEEGKVQQQNEEWLFAEEKIEKLQAKIQDLEEVKVSMTKALEDFKNKVKLKHENNVLNTQLDESLLVAAANQAQADEHLSLAKKQHEELQNELSLKTKMYSDKENELQCTINELQSTVLLLDSVKQEKAELNKKTKLLEEKIAALRNLEDEVRLLNSENKELKGELDCLSAVKLEKEQLNSKIQTLELSKDELNEAIRHLKDENEALRTKCNCLNCVCGQVVSLKKENHCLSKKIDEYESQKSVCLNCESLKDDMQHIHSEFEEKLHAKDEEMENKMRLVLKEFSKQINFKDLDCDQTVTELIEKTQSFEEQLQREHRLEIAALKQSIFEKDFALEEMHEHYEEIIKDKDLKILEYEENLKSLQITSGKAVCNDTENAVCNEVSDWDDTWVVPEENCDNLSPTHHKKLDCDSHLQQIESMQKELAKCNSELKDLRILLRLSPPQPLHSNNNYNSSIDVPQPTEFEYLRNILFQYMMGRETVTLVKVIAAVLRFSDEQTRLIVEREKTKQSAR